MTSSMLQRPGSAASRAVREAASEVEVAASSSSETAEEHNTGAAACPCVSGVQSVIKFASKNRVLHTLLSENNYIC